MIAQVLCEAYGKCYSPEDQFLLAFCFIAGLWLAFFIFKR